MAIFKMLARELLIKTGHISVEKSPFLNKFRKSQSDQVRESCRGSGVTSWECYEGTLLVTAKTLDGCLVTSNLHFAWDP